MTTNTIHIFGGGIAGLTVAHEILERQSNFRVNLYESNSELGGFARSSTTPNGLPIEHSWRGYADFYFNTFDVLKRIPTNSGKTVFDNLSKPLSFLLPHDVLTERGPKPTPNFLDLLIAGYPVLKCLMSGDSRKNTVFATMPFVSKRFLRSVSPEAYDQYVHMLGPGLGLSPNRVSVYDIAKYTEMSIAAWFQPETTKKYFQTVDKWRVMTAPTSKAWFDPWKSWLQKNGLTLHFNHELRQYILDPTQHTITSCLVRNNSTGENLQIGSARDVYVFCINPYNLADIILRSFPSGYTFKSLPMHQRLLKITTEQPPHKQIAFTWLLDKSVKSPTRTIVLAFPDSEFTITLCPQDRIFFQDAKFGIWSGTICQAQDDRLSFDIESPAGKLFNLPAEFLTVDKIQQELIYQIFRSAELAELVRANNTFELRDLVVLEYEIWKEWTYDPYSHTLISSARKWVTSINTLPKWRPEQKTQVSNLFFGGAHTATSTHIWSMESAVESGKIIAKYICTPDKPKISFHSHLLPLNVLQSIDDILFQARLPHLLDLVLLFTAIAIFLQLVK